MKVNFLYSKEKDIWCLLNKGKSSNNSNTPTAVYQELVSEMGESPDETSTASFIDAYLKKHVLRIKTITDEYQKIFDGISREFQDHAEKVFGVSISKDLNGYLTINSRCPYNIEENWFFVSITKPNPELTMMHELWHFYTWNKFGKDEQARLGFKKYNELKEALTVLINIECAHLLPEGIKDEGYSQHHELRGMMLRLWSQKLDINYVWDEASRKI